MGYDIDIYNQLPKASPLVVRYNPYFIARGGDRLVYRSKTNQRIVIKVSWRKIKDIVMACGADIDAQRIYAKCRLSSDICRKRRALKLQEMYFGKAHVLPERWYMLEAPISHEILVSLFRNDYQGRQLPECDFSSERVWTYISIQKYISAVGWPEHLTFSFGTVVEDGEIDEAVYVGITDQLINGTTNHIFQECDFLNLQDCSKERHLTKLIHKSHRDFDLRRAVMDFVAKAINYATAEGEALALAGQDNVIFYKQADGWTYTLIDATPVPEEPFFRHFVSRAAHSSFLVEDESAIGSQRDNFVRILNFARVLNGVAAALGMEERLLLPHLPISLIRGALRGFGV